jgi:alpha-glucosidase (family GH31 glycosyl hydrolase)
MDQYKFPTDPVAEPSSIIKGPNYRFTLIHEYVTRFEWAEDGVFEDRPSTFAINRRFHPPEHHVRETEDFLEIITPSVHISYDKKRFSTNGLTASFIGKTVKWGTEWRYGDEDEFDTNLGGTARTLDNINGRCDMGHGILARYGYAFLDDSKSMLFEENGFVGPRRPGDRIDGYLFSYGLEFKGVMKAFYAISGHQPLIPRWALGNWWSRYYAYSAEEYLALMDKFRDRDIPFSVAVLDMDWHHVAGDHVPHAGWTGYSWNKELFPDPKGFCDALHRRRLKTTLNDHPHSGIHHHEDMYEELGAILGHDTSKKTPILFDSTSPKFMHAYLNVLHRRLEDDGCDFWWIDWQQGPHSRIPGLDPLWMLNHFHFLDHKQQSKSSRPLIFSRFGGPGSHRYPVGFSGDTIATWESLQFQPEFTATASNIGYGWWSHDIGGHMGGYKDDELSTRWVQLGVFSPLMRLHSTENRWNSKEPWRFRKENEQVMTSLLQFRHRLVPYLHSMNRLAATDDEPLVQPLYWKFPSRDEVYDRPNEYFFGTSLVVAPVVHPRDSRTNHAAVDAWVPPSRHIDIITGLVYDGDRKLKMYRPLESIPVLAPEGSIIPLDGLAVPRNGCPNPSVLEVLVVVGKDGHFTIYEDEADDDVDQPSGKTEESRSIQVEYKQTEGRLNVSSSGKSWAFRFLGMSALPPSCAVLRDGVECKEAGVSIEKVGFFSSLVVQVPNLSGREAGVCVTLGPDSQLGVVDGVERIEALLADYQVAFDVKDKILAIAESDHSSAVKANELLSLGVENVYLGPILEILTADSRSR